MAISRCCLILLSLVSVLQSQVQRVCALGASNDVLMSRLKTIQCELSLAVGRIPGTAMPPEWAASGAKLALSVEVEFTDESCPYEMTKERLLTGDVAIERSSLLSVEPLNEPTFISSKGQETVKVTSGAYGCQIQGLASQQYLLRFFFDFPEGAVRNDVTLPAERIYFLSSCWIKDDGILDRANQRKSKLLKSLQSINEELEELKRSSAGFFQKALGFRQSVILIERRAEFQSELERLEQTYPLDPSRIVNGPNNIIFAKDGVIAVKRFRGAYDTKEQYHWIGTFIFNEFFEDEEIE